MNMRGALHWERFIGSSKCLKNTTLALQMFARNVTSCAHFKMCFYVPHFNHAPSAFTQIVKSENFGDWKSPTCDFRVTVGLFVSCVWYDSNQALCHACVLGEHLRRSKMKRTTSTAGTDPLALENRSILIEIVLFLVSMIRILLSCFENCLLFRFAS